MNEQLTVKDFFKFVEEFKKGREIDSATQRATLKAIQGLGNKISKTNERVTTKEEPGYQPSFKERLMSGVATAKSIGSGIKSVVKNPIETIKTGGTAIGTKIADAEMAMEKYVGNIMSTPKDFKLPTSKESKNPEADNIETPEEIAADAAKDNVELSKQILDTNEEALSQLKLIGKALTGTTPAIGGEKPSSSASVSPQPPSSDGPGMGVNIDLPDRKPKPDAPPKKEGKPGGKAAGAVGKGIGKSLIKKIPLVGAVAGLGFGAYRLMQGDTAGAAMEVASGVAGSIPGVGTAASVGIDAALAAKDAKAAEATTAPAPSAAAPAEKQAPVSKPSKPKEETAKIEKKKESTVSPIEGEKNLEQLQIAQGELQGIYKDYRDEKAKVSEKLAGDRKNYPQGFADDPADPEYPKELKSIDDKYKKLIDTKKKEIEKLSKAPGISEAKAKQAKADADWDADEKEMAAAKTKTTVTGEKTKTTSETTVIGGGSETTKMVLSEDAKKAEAEGPAMSKRHQAEYTELRSKLQSEGKLEGKSRREIMELPEIKELRARQSEEQSARGRRVTDGMTFEVTKTSGENAVMRDEMSASSGSTQPIVSNNVSNTSTNNFMPMKADPRPTHRGSALDRYNERVSAY